MAESMKGLKRTHRCTEVTAKNIGETVTVMGWVAKQRNKGGIIFVDLRDRSGILQLIFEEDKCGSENFEKAMKLRSEYVVAVVGKVEKRAGATNENLKTGDIEVIAEQVRILSDRREQQDKGRDPSEIPLSGSEKTGSAEKPDPAQ